MTKNSRLRDYGECRWEKSELLWAVVQSAAMVGVVAYFFYRSFLAAVFLSPMSVLYFRHLQERKKERDRNQLALEFKECILAVAAALQAGYAVENAFLESGGDLELLYGEEGLMLAELKLIQRGLVINITLEELLIDLGGRSHSREIRQFAEVFSIARRTGGSLAEIIGTSAGMIGARIEVNREIQTLLGGRRLEQKIMRMMPFGILLYIGSAYPGYFNGLYHNWKGVLVMTGCLGICLLACWMSHRILGKIAAELES